jgi:two-component system chemotaxis sensor kinase CheA
MEPLLRGTKAIAQRVNALGAGKTVPPAPRDLLDALGSVDVYSASAEGAARSLDLAPKLLAKLNSSELEQLSRPSDARRSFQLVFTPSTDRAARGSTITSVRERLTELGEIVKVIPDSGPDGGLRFLLLVVSAASREELAAAVESPADEVTAIAEPEVSAPFVDEAAELGDAHSTMASMLRVDVRRVDAAMDGLGELMVANYRLQRAVAALQLKGTDVRDLQETVQDTKRKLRDVRALVLGLRMISLSELLDRLPILVRGLRGTTGKTADLEVDVGRFEVDKSVGERLWPALVHLVRNAIDHGLETESERLRSGKREHGTIRVHCTRSSNSRLELTVEDDGAGVDAARVAARAGRPLPESPEELLDLMARPGLSTRDAATATSGRGMGLDIARRIVTDELGGTVSLETTPGVGTRFTLDVPITVAVVDAFRFQSEDESYLVPVGSVEEFVDVDPSEVVRGPFVNARTNQAALLTKKGRTMPLVELSSVLGRSRRGVSGKAIVVRRSEQLFAFGVDRLLGLHEVIVRRLSDPLVDAAGVAGAVDLGDGRPTLLLDLIALSRLHGESELS